MTVRIPAQGVFSQPNKGDIFGNLSETQNVDLRTNPGRLRLSPRLTVAVKDNDTSITNMGVPSAFAAYETTSARYIAMCGIGEGSGLGNTGSGKLMISDDSSFTSDWDNDGLANTPTTIHAGFSDMVVWNDWLLVSIYSGSAHNISKLAATTWTASWFLGTLGATFNVSNGSIKNMCPGFNGNLYITDGDSVIYIAASGVSAVTSGTGTIDTGGKYTVTWIRSSSNKLWIGLMSPDAGIGTKGFVAEWDATGTAVQKIYDINAPSALSCVIVDDVPYIIDAFGILKKYTGTGFSEVARLPVANQNIEMPGIYNDLTNTRWINHRGMDVSNGQILINVNNFVSSGVYVQDMPSGIWVFDPKKPEQGIYHQNSPCADSNDNGQQLLLTAGAVFGTKRTIGNYLAGYGYYTDSGSTSRNGAFYDDVATTTNKRGIFTLPFIQADQIEDVFQKASYRHSPLPSGDKIIAKFRTQKSTTLPFIASFTCVSGTQFTSTDANFANVSVGNECQFVQGKHSGTTAHVSAIQVAGGTYTVDLDESVLSSSGSGKVKMTNFKKVESFSQQNQMSHESPLSDAGSTTKIQIKTELRFSGDTEIDDLTLLNEGKKLLK